MSSSHTPNVKTKRRRTTRADSNASGSSPLTLSSRGENKDQGIKKIKSSSSLQQTDDSKNKVIHYEEEEVDQRSPDHDVQLYKETCHDISKIMKEIFFLKHSDRKDVTQEIQEKRIQASLLFINLKKLNRLAHIRNKKARDVTNEAKQRVDNFQLQLQNLLYEMMHLQKEVTKCLEFKSKDEEIELVSLQEFYNSAPPQISKKEITLNDVHEQTLARLDWELEQRKRLAEQCEVALANKDVLMEEIKKQQEHLDNLQPWLNNILHATKPVQEYLRLPFDEKRQQLKMAQFLPGPLYVLFVQANAYHDACDKHIRVIIEGDVEDARSLKIVSAEFDEESGDSEQEESTSKRRRKTLTNRLTEKRNQILKKHPLSVVLNISCKDGSVMSITFTYMLVLHMVTVSVKLSLGSTAAAVNGELLSPDCLLTCLYPEDYGDDTPNPANHYQLNKLGMASFKNYVSEIGQPFIWAQWLSGLEFLESSTSTIPQPAISASHMEETIKRLRNRFHARLSLQKQLISLERNSIPVQACMLYLFPTKILSHLTSWKSLVYEDFVSLPYCKHLIEAELVDPSDWFFHATVERGTAKLWAAIVISPDYPETAPVFALNILWKHERNALNDDNVREMACELNVYYSEIIATKSLDQLLTNQMQLLLMCFDIFLETEATNTAIEGPTEISKENLFPITTRGRSRSKPWKYNTQLGLFTHR